MDAHFTYRGFQIRRYFVKPPGGKSCALHDVIGTSIRGATWTTVRDALDRTK